MQMFGYYYQIGTLNCAALEIKFEIQLKEIEIKLIITLHTSTDLKEGQDSK